jgi:ABC-type Na+ efflux pump permease subunit
MSMSPLPASTKGMPQANRGCATMIAAQRETAGSGNATPLGAADWLCLAAAPTFAIMALLTGVLGGGRMDMLCSAAQDASSLSGMVPMYLLMSAFHSPPWLKLLYSRRSRARRS